MIIFAGPSLNNFSKDLIKKLHLELHPPIQRGDLIRLQKTQSNESELAIVDGYFHQSLSVSHEEILLAIKRGWKVTGLSSLGAIRAYELRNMGMHGYGKVYQRFVDNTDFQDDEVALSHYPGGDYQSLSEPLIHFRVCLEILVAQKKIQDDIATEIIDSMKNRYFGERTMILFKQLLKQKSVMEFKDVIDDFNVFRIKQSDLVNFLQNE